MNKKFKYMVATIVGGLLGAVSMVIYPINASEDLIMTDEQVIQIVRKELNRLINEQSVLDPAIERGIINFVKKQQVAANSAKDQRGVEQAKKIRPVSKEQDHIYGDINAPLTLVEYSDFECPFCKRFHPAAKKFVDQSGGQVNWVYRHFPLGFHNPVAQKEAEAAECAASQGGHSEFWSYSDLIYEKTRSNGNGLNQVQLVSLARDRGLKVDAFKQCLESGEMESRVKADYQNGVAAGVTGTPGNFLINNQSGKIAILNGAVPLAQLSSAAKGLLAN